jgi:hypothetical protein
MGEKTRSLLFRKQKYKTKNALKHYDTGVSAQNLCRRVAAQEIMEIS